MDDDNYRKLDDEELVRVFVKMLQEDAEHFPHLMKSIAAFTNVIMQYGQRRFQPVLFHALFIRQDSGDMNAELDLHTEMIGSMEVIEKFKLRDLVRDVLATWYRWGEMMFRKWGIKTNKDDMGDDIERDPVMMWEHAVKDKKKLH